MLLKKIFDAYKTLKINLKFNVSLINEFSLSTLCADIDSEWDFFNSISMEYMLKITNVEK